MPQHWKQERNYRRVRGKNGITLAYIITIDGQDIEVTRDVFLVYSQLDRRERYLTEQYKDLRSPLDAAILPSAEEILLQKENCSERHLLLNAAMDTLTDREAQLVDALYGQNLSIRTYAKQVGRTPSSIFREKRRILKKFTNFFSHPPETKRQKIGIYSEGTFQRLPEP